MSLLTSVTKLRSAVDELNFGGEVACVYNPLGYAFAGHQQYLEKFGQGTKKILFLGMNPGPFGMAQTGVPFGEIEAVSDWMGIEAPIEHPDNEHPKRPIDGFLCARSEVSGRRLWGLFKERFVTPEAFFSDHFVANYCPLVFMTETGKNVTPDKLPPSERDPLFAICDEHLRELVGQMQPDCVIGVGKFAEARAAAALDGMAIRIETVLHPSPASPAANRGWSEAATKKMRALGLWD